MSNDTPTRILRDQHQNILKIADILEEVLAHEPEPGAFDYDSIADCVSFIRLYADALHHGKEEDLLFPELESLGMSRDMGPIAVMLYEHQQGRAYARQMADSLAPARDGDEQALEVLQSGARGYIDLIRGHILKEDRILFEMADQAVRGSACERLCGGYGAVCARRFEGHSKDELQALAGRITERAGLV